MNVVSLVSLVALTAALIVEEIMKFVIEVQITIDVWPSLKYRHCHYNSGIDHAYVHDNSAD